MKPSHPPTCILVLALFLVRIEGASLAEPVDQPYPGTLTLSVDLTDSARKILRVRETIPVQAGALALHYPKWIPGHHRPTDALGGVTGVKFSTAGRSVAWRRDPVDMFTLHVEVPPSATSLELEFQYVVPTVGTNVPSTNNLIVMPWNQVAFYPGGSFARRVRFQPGVTLPAGWSFGTALEVARQDGNVVQFKPVDLETLVDSPLTAGRIFKRLDLAPGATPAVHLDLFAERPEQLAITDEQLSQHRALVTQARALLGAQHYAHYDFLLTLSENRGFWGLEHHQSSDDGVNGDYFLESSALLSVADLLPHEYFHSWNGKFRRPADLWTPNFNVPMKGSLLWVYEGLTQYYGNVLTGRCGLRTPEQFRDQIAATAAGMSSVAGRAWRPLQDTADAAQILYPAPPAWQSWRRGCDFYPESQLIWLDADTLIRERSSSTHSLDDFARAFFGTDDGRIEPVTYTFDDVVSALNRVQPHDWAAFLRARLDTTAPAAPLDGLARGGWKLVYTDQPTDYFKSVEKTWKFTNLTASLGVSIDAGHSAGTLNDVLWGGPAFEAGLAPAMKLVAVNGEKFSPELLKDAIKAAKDRTEPIELLVQNLERFTTAKVDYHGGLKYPRLERVEGTPDRIGDIGRAK